jgi:hypothetical protein
MAQDAAAQPKEVPVVFVRVKSPVPAVERDLLANSICAAL